MFRFVIPIILISLSVAGFFTFTNPLYSSISDLRQKIASYNEALDNSKALEAERDKLTQKYNSFDPENITRLSKLLPDNVDNIRLILEIEKVALPYGMVLKDVKYDTVSGGSTAQANPNGVQGGAATTDNKGYGTWNLEFSTQGTYTNFLNFIKDLESNLRIADISSIAFSSDTGGAVVNPQLSESYKYAFKIKTYWLKN